MDITESPHSVRRCVSDLLFHNDPEARGLAAAALGKDPMGVASEREALEALSAALHDPVLKVQEAALQSLVRLGRK